MEGDLSFCQQQICFSLRKSFSLPIAILHDYYLSHLLWWINGLATYVKWTIFCPGKYMRARIAPLHKFVCGLCTLGTHFEGKDLCSPCSYTPRRVMIGQVTMSLCLCVVGGCLRITYPNVKMKKHRKWCAMTLQQWDKYNYYIVYDMILSYLIYYIIIYFIYSTFCM